MRFIEEALPPYLKELAREIDAALRRVERAQRHLAQLAAGAVPTSRWRAWRATLRRTRAALVRGP